MSHEAYVQSVRRRAADIAEAVLVGELPLLEGCHLITELRWEAEVGDQDPDFTTLAMLSSEADALPVGEVRKRWSPEALARLEPEIEAMVERATPQAIPACRSLVTRFGPNNALERSRGVAS